MTDYIVIVVLLVIAAVAGWAVYKRLRGETSCCSGSTYKARSKKLKTVAEKKIFTVEGMHCQNCVNRVMEALNSLEGVSAAVYLKKGEAVVSAETQIDEEAIRSVIEKAGYTVTGVR